jgi:hypothetical protein
MPEKILGNFEALEKGVRFREDSCYLLIWNMHATISLSSEEELVFLMAHLD